MAGRAGRFGAVGRLRLVPASREDFADKLESFLGTIHNVYANSHDEAGSLSRQIVFRDWGESSWRASYPRMTDLERVERLTELLVEFAGELELGAVRMSSTFDIGGGKFSRMYPLQPFPPSNPWGSTPQLWSEYVPDAHGIQVINDAQLAKAHDLSGWHVETVASGHHLVKARNLTAWFPGEARTGTPGPVPPGVDPMPPPETLAKARRDFGEMIITDDIADEWRMRHLASADGRTDGRERCQHV